MSSPPGVIIGARIYAALLMWCGVYFVTLVCIIKLVINVKFELKHKVIQLLDNNCSYEQKVSVK